MKTMIQLLLTVEDARLVRDALREYLRNDGTQMSDVQQDTLIALGATVSQKIVEENRRVGNA